MRFLSARSAARIRQLSLLFGVSIFSLSALPQRSFACACGCNVFDVATSADIKTSPGDLVFFQYDYVNQNQNWHGTTSAPSENNDDKRIRTNFFTTGYEHFFNRRWGFEATVPFWNRLFKADDEDTGKLGSENNTRLADIRLKAIYTGFSDTMSTGVNLGVKLPTGKFTDEGVDRDTQIGTGSTHALIGAYHVGSLTDDHLWDYYTNSELDLPAFISGSYRPGTEVDAVFGAYYDGFSVQQVKIQPLAQVVGVVRSYDRGAASGREDSGYQRLLVEPGFEISVAGWKVFADVGFPVLQDFRGNQLTSREQYTLNFSKSF